MPLRALPSRRSTRIVGALTVLAAASLVSGALLIAPTAQAASGCTVTYQPNAWAGGFTANVKLTAGAEALSGWTVTWTYTGDQRVTNAWNSQVTMSGSAVTATNAAWNGQVSAGGSVEFGLQGTWSAANPTPTDFAVNGVACNDTGATPAPSASPTTTPPVTTPPVTTPPVTTPPVTTPPVTPSSPPPSDPSATPSATPPGNGGGGGAGCAGAAFCDGFENQASLAAGGNWSVVHPNCSGTGTAAIDSTVAHSGGRSVRINGAAGYCNHVFVKANADLSTTGPIWFGRMYVRHSTALPVTHTTFMAMKDTADAGKDLRMGGQNSTLQWNRESDDATLPEQSPNGVALSRPLPTNVWNCIEFQVDGRTGTLRTWLGGAEVPGLVIDGVPTQDIDSQWLRKTWRPALSDLRLGWESYGSDANTLWFDDVAVGSTRIGC